MANGDETFIGAIDQGTSSTRFLIFNSKTQEVVASHQVILSRDFGGCLQVLMVLKSNYSD